MLRTSIIESVTTASNKLELIGRDIRAVLFLTLDFSIIRKRTCPCVIAAHISTPVGDKSVEIGIG